MLAPGNPDENTPIQVLFNILVRYGYVDSHASFAKLIRINKKNVSAYLAGRDAVNRIVPRVDTLHCWGWGLSQCTDLKLQLLLVDRDLFWYVTGHDVVGMAIPRRDKWSTTHALDFQPMKSWREEPSAQGAP